MGANYFTMLGIGLASVIGLGYLLWSLKKNNPTKKMGELLSRETIKNNEFILESILMVLFMSEAMTAATVMTVDQNQGFAFGRFLMHMSISFVGAVCSITLIRDIATIFEKKPHFGYYINNFFIALILLGISFYVPFFNVQAIASNLKQSYQFQEWMYKMWSSEASYNVYLLKHGFPEIRDVYAEMETVLKVSIGQGILHILVTVLLGLRATSTAARFKALMDKDEEEKKEDDKDKKDGDKKEPEMDEFDKNTEWLLKRVGYTDATKITNLVKNARKVMEKLDAKDRGIIGTNLNQIKAMGKKADDLTDTDAKKKAKDDVKKRIYEVFSNRPNAKENKDKGLGMSIKSGN